MKDEQFDELKGMFQKNSQDIAELKEIVKQNSQDIAELKEIVKQNSQDIAELKEIVKQNTEDIKKNREEILRQGILFENEYGNKISAIFDKLMLNDEIKMKQDGEFTKFKTRFEYNDTVLKIHEDRITALEEKVGS